MKILNASQMRAMDKRAMENLGIIGPILMENAGLEIVRAVEARFPDIQHEEVVIVAGKGNNGGDGFVVARHLNNRGCRPIILLLAKKEEIKGDAGLNLNIADKMGIPITEITLEEEWNRQIDRLSHSSLVVDAIFGTGLTKPAQGFFAQVIEDINRSPGFKVAVDIPSGLSSDSFQIIGPCIKADLTVTMAAPKIAHVFAPSEKFVGELVIADISIPPSFFEDDELKLEMINKETVAPYFHRREKDSHKGTYGHLFILSGSLGKTGAAILAGKAALTMGAGLVTIGTPKSCLPIVARDMAELMTEPLEETPDWTLAIEALDDILALVKGKDAVLIGPGISTHESTSQLILSLLPQVDMPMVLDADGLNILAKDLDILKSISSPVILTPHPGEFARLLGVSNKQVVADKLQLAPEFAQRYGVFLVLKGYRTLIATPEGKVYINPTGNPGMATGGSGDVLSGMIAAMIMQGDDVLGAIIAAVYLHGLSGDEAARNVGEKALVAGNIVSYLSQAMRILIEPSSSVKPHA